MSDGYCGNWKMSQESGAPPSPTWPWPLKPASRPTLFDLCRTENSFLWKCRECGAIYETPTFTRPDHPICQAKKSA